MNELINHYNPLFISKKLIVVQKSLSCKRIWFTYVLTHAIICIYRHLLLFFWRRNKQEKKQHTSVWLHTRIWSLHNLTPFHCLLIISKIITMLFESIEDVMSTANVCVYLDIYTKTPIKMIISVLLWANNKKRL